MTKARDLAQIRRRIVACTRCPDLRQYCAAIARTRKREFADQRYWGRPVPPLGDGDARLLIVGLAPAAHGGNRTGRMFTGDGSADWLARALFRSGFATQPSSTRLGDGYALVDAYMTAAIRCAPPQNKPSPLHIARCASHMDDELEALVHVRVIVALGKIGFDVILRQLRVRGFSTGARAVRFGHGLEYVLQRTRGDHVETVRVIASYHPSRQNTNTGRLSQAALDAIFVRARVLLPRSQTASAPGQPTISARA
ncbi:MAG: uracil-DNA glycosylase [Candidatus Eremiobacteraeota bacterium]|nr:uracil-DNA glycosylase [Candidatus Eremiobacteraeota bacterium]